MEKSVKITLIIAVGVLVLTAIGIFAFMSLRGPSNTLTSQGVATIKVMPDVIGIYFNVETNGPTAAEAKNANSKIIDKLTGAIVALGFSKDRIQTQGYNIYPWQEWIGNKYVDKGYKASHQIKIELNSSERDKIGEVIDAGVDAGALISFINFELSRAKQNEYKAQTLKQASEDARVKAQAVAEGLGKQIGKLVSVSTSDFGYYPWNIYASREGTMAKEDAALAKEAATRITPGEQEISASVSTVWELK